MSIETRSIQIDNLTFSQEIVRIPLGDSLETCREARMGHGPQIVSYLALAIKSGLLRWILANPQFTLSKALQISGWKNRPQCAICLRMWVSCGWLVASGPIMEDTVLALSSEGRASFEMASQIEEAILSAWEFIQVGDLLKLALIDSSLQPFKVTLIKVLQHFHRGWGLSMQNPRLQILDYLDGTVAQIIHLSVLRAEVYNFLDSDPAGLMTKFSWDVLQPCLQALCTYGYLKENQEAYQFTSLGVRARRSHTGWLSMSYLPTFKNLSALLEGDMSCLVHRDPLNGFETHVDRELNIDGSKINHQNILGLSKALDRWLPELFSNQSSNAEINYVCDMGCGTGSLLLSVYRCIQSRTDRGKRLDLSPITLVGVDLNEECCQAASRTLQDVQIPHKVMLGDVSDPKGLSDDLKKAGIDRHEVLHIRSFLDHDRAFKNPKLSLLKHSTGSGIYLAEDGSHIANAKIEANLIEYLSEWREILGAAGMIVIELHAADPKEIVECGGRAPMEIEYVQFLTCQFPVEYRLWISCALRAGLQVKKSFCFAYGPSESSYVSITHFVVSDSH